MNNAANDGPPKWNPNWMAMTEDRLNEIRMRWDPIAFRNEYMMDHVMLRMLDEARTARPAPNSVDRRHPSDRDLHDPVPGTQG